MKILFYIIIIIIIYIYVLKNNLMIIPVNFHYYFWGTISILLFLCYLIKYHKGFVYKSLKYIHDTDKKPYYYK